MTDFLTKVAQTYGDFLGYFEKHVFKFKTAMAFWDNFCKRLFFILTSTYVNEVDHNQLELVFIIFLFKTHLVCESERGIF